MSKFFIDRPIFAWVIALVIMLVGALFIIPFILMYTAWSYYVFRGKVTEEDGYH